MTGDALRAPRYPDRDRNAEGRAENARPRDRFGRPLPRGNADELGDRRNPDEVAAGITEAFAEAVALFDAERFFEAHEFLEYIWKSDEVAERDRDFWKGVTQVAVGCCHAQRGNDDGAVRLLERATRYMAPYPPRYHGVAASDLAAVALAVAEQVRTTGASPDLDFPPFPRVT
ncbi:MAG: DUF309 domain-containing protein [Euzebyales bacterium]|nr:DUF309 domain-containing protein [Euzebyales bacterium]